MSQQRKHYPKGFVELNGVIFPLPPRARQRRLTANQGAVSGRALVGLVLFGAGIFFAFPFIFSAQFGLKNDPTKALPGSALRRGAYMNWGSKDVGPDLDYYKMQRELREKNEEEQNQQNKKDED
eukprot:TRINITY_DN4677_c0_g1_i1.p4 TRINITY_DN4677_c0_g1~~TRINITY_DN4677_c0_g1_i1.p4  ORF type:complete len:133 (-),score=18.00 TRINITY_DN4677_c0_g1_i1:318-689(-)